ncbi:MAG TPA: VanW family protein [Acidimicrobiia bacterium]|nr:VanW family protein [Acidimicrobiia bacterium]
MARHREHYFGWLWVLPSLAIPLVISAVAWTSHVSSEGDVIAANVRFAGVDVSGLSPEVAAAHVEWREAAFLETPVTIDLGGRLVKLPARELGYDYLYVDTVNSVVSARHEDNAWDEFVAWITTPLRPVTVEDQFVLDESVARERLAGEDFVVESPVEPELTYSDGAIEALAGVPGTGVDIDWMIEALSIADVDAGPTTINATLAEIAPTVSVGEADAAAERAHELTAEEVVVRVGTSVGRLAPTQIRRHVVSAVEDGEMTISIDFEGLHRALEDLFTDPVGEIEKPVLEVVDGEVAVVREGTPPPICCSAESIREAAELLLDPDVTILRLEPRPDDDPTIGAWADGSLVTEAIAEFTTTHACCENRVTNIQTMADAVTGYYMLPGETLSFNDYIGPRTREKGYLPAGAIRGGHMTDEVGGGVSQFVTTMFNAAYFAGLELDQYQSHSVYFSRYPFGREATLSIPGPDLVITNSTDYPVLIWPTYDPTSITVTLYSTQHIDVVELDQRISFRSQCRHSQIDRQRTYPDGRVVVDTIVANYRPADGIDCNGDVIPPPPD